jgi:hypothetical protein
MEGGERDKLADLIFKQAVLALGARGNNVSPPGLATTAGVENEMDPQTKAGSRSKTVRRSAQQVFCEG